MSTTKPAPAFRNRRSIVFWATPLFSVALGLAMGGAAWIGGQPGFAIFAVLLMLTVAVGLVLASSRSETVNGLLDGQDERIKAINRDATGIAGSAVIWAIIVAFIYELITGGDAQPYAWLGAIGGASYVLAVIGLRIWR